ncbi:MAG: Histidine kinaselike ATPase domain [Actinomycetota bacterium]
MTHTVVRRRRTRLVDDAATARRFVTSSLRALAAPPDVVSSLKLVVSELVSNAIRNTHGAARVTVNGNRAGWTVEVVGGDQPPGHLLWDPSLWALHTDDRTSGRGLGLVRMLVDRVRVDRVLGDARVRCSIERRPNA